MKFAFLDESGKSDKPISVVAGVVVDAYLVHALTREWDKVLAKLGQASGGRTINEFHMRNAYGGQEEWRSVSNTNRGIAIETVLEFLSDRANTIVFSATQKNKYEARVRGSCALLQEMGSRWVSECFHVALSINKQYKGSKKNKGKTTLIFDEGAGYEKQLSGLLINPPSWSDSYYARGKKELPLSEIFTTSLFADSEHAPLIQLADTVAFILRRISEIRDAGEAERYAGEQCVLESWLTKIQPRFQNAPHRYKKTGRCSCADLFYDLAPDSLRDL
jgi:hypothetical protein